MHVCWWWNSYAKIYMDFTRIIARRIWYSFGRWCGPCVLSDCLTVRRRVKRITCVWNWIVCVQVIETDGRPGRLRYVQSTDQVWVEQRHHTDDSNDNDDNDDEAVVIREASQHLLHGVVHIDHHQQQQQQLDDKNRHIVVRMNDTKHVH